MKLLVLSVMFLTLVSCENIFTTSAFADFKTDPEDMSSSELKAYANDILSDPNATDAEILEVALLLYENRIDPTNDELANDADIREQYVDESLQIAALLQKKADVDDILINLTQDSGTGNILGDLLDDQDRVDDLTLSSQLVAQAYSAEQLGGVTESEIPPTQLVIGGAGLISDIMQDPAKNAALEGAADLETATLTAAGFSAEEIGRIQTADAMVDSALQSGELSTDIADVITQGLPF